MNEVDSIVARLLTLHPKRIDLSLDRMWRILAALDHPELRLPPVIHVAGTNGKGSTIAVVAAEKAGILKREVPAIVAAQPREALAVIERQAARVKARIRIAGEDWTATEERGRLVYQDDAGLIDLPAPKLYGRHQFENAGLAIAALRAAGTLRLAPAAFEGVAKAEWPARRQPPWSGRSRALVRPGGELWLDGG